MNPLWPTRRRIISLNLYAFTKEYIDIWACDTASRHNKVFKISRIGEVKILGDWQMEEKHERRPIDSFRMSGGRDIPSST